MAMWCQSHVAFLFCIFMERGYIYMPNNIDSLEIKIKANATTANNALEKLVANIEKLEIGLSSINATPMKELANGVSIMASAMNHMKSVGSVDFTRLSKNINKLVSSATSANAGKAASQLGYFTNSIQKLSNASQQASQLANLGNAIGVFGSKKMESASANLPKLANALTQLFAQLSKAPAVNSSLIQMTNALANLSANGQKVGSATRGLRSNLNQYSASASRASKHTFSLAAAFGKFYATYFLVVRGIKSLWKGIQSSMDYVETFNYFNVTMNKIGEQFKGQYSEFGYESADAYAESFTIRMNELTKKMTGYSVGKAGELSWANIDNLGLDPNQLMNFQARLGAVTNSVGLVGEASIQTSKALSMLSADLSSLTNTDIDTVMTNLSSGLIGQSRALYKYGIDITNASLANVAFANGITKSISAMSQSEKMQLRVLAILDQSKIAWGDQANTIDSVANQYRIFTQQVHNLGRILGNLFLPIVKNVLPYVNGLIMALSRLFETLGFKFYGSSWLTDLMDGISGANFQTDDFEDSIEGIGDELENDAKSANKLKKALQGFDELNVLSTNDNGNQLAISDTIDLSMQIKDAVDEYEKKWSEAFAGMENKAKGLADRFVGYFEPVTRIFDKLFEGDFEGAGKETSNLVSSIFNTISNAIDKVDWNAIGEKIGEFLKGVDWLKVLNSVGEVIYQGLKGVLELWFGHFKSDPFSALTLAFATIAFRIGGKKLTYSLFKLLLGESIGATSTAAASGSLFASFALPITIVVGLAFIAKNHGEEIQKELDKWVAKLVYGMTDEAAEEMSEKSAKLRKELQAQNDKTLDMWKDIFKEWGKKMDDTISPIISKIKDGLNDLIAKYDVLIGKAHIASSGNIHGGGGRRINGFASGGFVRSADVFMANENGIPELVGTVGGRTAVASGTEITGISDAVYDTGSTQAQLLSAAVNLLQVIANKDFGASDDYIFNSFRRSAENYTNRTGNPAIPI